MNLLLAAHEVVCFAVSYVLVRLLVAVEDHRRRFPRRVRRRGSLRRRLLQWLVLHGLAPPPRFFRRAIPWNRTPDHREVEVIRLHVDQPRLGAGQLRWLLFRIFGWLPARETVRQIIIRRRDLVLQIVERRRCHRRIVVTGPRQLWGLDLTMVWLLGLVPVWILGVVDYHGSRLLAFEPLARASAAEVRRVLERAFDQYGAPESLLTDRGPVLREQTLEELLAARGTRHVLTLPGHPWTNGRIERVFGTFKRLLRQLFWMVASRAQLQRICADFLFFYNRDRPHSAWQGRTPDEVFFDRAQRRRPLGRVVYFDGRLEWYRLGL